MLADCIGQRMRAPDKDTAIPVEIPCCNKFLCALMVWLFCKSAYTLRSIIEYIACFNVAIPRFRTRRRDAKHYHVFASGRDPDGVLEHCEKRSLITDDMVRRENSQHRIRICLFNEKCSQTCSRSGITRSRFAYHLFWWHNIKLIANRWRKK